MNALIKRFLVLAMALPFGLLSMCSKGADIIGEFSEEFHKTPPAQELYDIAMPILEETLSQDDTEFVINYLYPERYRDLIKVNGDTLIVERMFDVDAIWEDSETKYEYYFDGKIARNDLTTGEKTIRQGEFDLDVQEIRTERKALLQKAYELILSDVERTMVPDQYAFEFSIHCQTLTMTFDREQMDAAGYADLGEEVVFSRYYSLCWKLEVSDIQTGRKIHILLPHNGEYDGAFVLPTLPETFSDYTVIE